VLDVLLAPRCAGCDLPGAWLCTDCVDACEPVSRGRLQAAGTYGGPLARALQRFKYRGERGLAAELGSLVAARVASDLARGAALDVVVPAVLHADRARERGYDQAALLAAVVAERTALPLRVRYQSPQGWVTYSDDLTVSLAEGGAGLGTAFGEQKAVELLTEAGFTGITVTPAPGDPLGGVFVATRSAT